VVAVAVEAGGLVKAAREWLRLQIVRVHGLPPGIGLWRCWRFKSYSMAPADEAIQEAAAVFSMRRRERGGRRVVQVSSTVGAIAALRSRIKAQSKDVATHIAADPDAQSFIDDWTSTDPVSR
jgi:hypothetical protein